jgi:hypothetical protein
VSLDILKKFHPDICASILDWDFKVYPPGYFHTVWASPPCTEYSHAKRVGVRKLAQANAIVKRTLEILEYFEPDVWFLENPQTGLLKDQEMMWGLPYLDVDYCQYGMSYRKRTRIWTNVELAGRLCPGAGHCSKMNGGRHLMSCGNGYTSDTKTDSIYSGRKYTERAVPLCEKYSIPRQLVEELFTDV